MYKGCVHESETEGSYFFFLPMMVTICMNMWEETPKHRVWAILIQGVAGVSIRPDLAFSMLEGGMDCISWPMACQKRPAT